MRIDEGKLRAYLDQALSPDELKAVEDHLRHSTEAQATLRQLRQAQAALTEGLNLLTPPQKDISPASQAFNRFQTNLGGQKTTPINRFNERIQIMFNNSFVKQYQSAIAALAVVAVVAILFSFAPVRALAGDFLKVFRVQNVEVIPVDVDQIEAMENNPEFKGLMDQFEPQLEVISEESEAQPVSSLAEAAGQVDFSVAEITALPSDLSNAPSRIMVEDEMIAHLNLDKDLLQAVFDAAEIEVALPDSLDEAPLVITKPDSVIQEWREGEKVVLGFMQLPAPSIEYPDDLDLDAFGVAGLQLLGMSKAEAVALGATIDWANTLILPIPSDANVMVSEISVNGDKGFLFTSEDPGDDGVGLMWQRNGTTYMIEGDYTPDEILKMAESVR